MRIAIWHNLPSGGGKRALYDHVTALLDQGHYLEVWRPPSRDDDYLPLGEMVKEHVVPLPEVRPGKVQALRQLLVDTDAAVDAMDRHCASCAREIESGDFDVLFANSCTLLRTTSIGRLTNLPALLYLQEPYRWLYEALPDPPWAADDRADGWWYAPLRLRDAAKRGLLVRRRQVRVREEVRNARAFDIIACNSLYSRESILRAYGLNATVCYLGIDVGRFSPPREPSRRRPFFLTVGAVDPAKNPEFIIRSLGRRTDRTWPLTWVGNFGSPEYVTHLKQVADQCAVKVDFKIRISDSELVNLYREACLLLYAPRLEPFGFPPLEAAACGLPTIAVAEAGTRETVVEGTNGFLVSATEESFAAKIDEALARPDLLRQLGARGRKYVERQWTLSDAGQRLERLLIQAAHSSGSGP
jgi:glycosyltransferase involved in cell wall biosynthesis